MEVLNNIEILKTELDGLRPLNAEAEARIMQKFRLDWNYHSNSLEGNSLTYGETKALILFGITAQGKPLKDHFEITGHDEAIKWVEEIVKEERPLTENFIRELNLLILKEPGYKKAVTLDNQQTQKRIEPGKYKTLPNHVLTQTGEVFYFASPEETPAKMNDLIEWFRGKKSGSETNHVILAAEFHYKFICIHPFDDGNGRTARILMNFILMQYGYPPVIIKTEDKSNYLSVLQQADAGILEPFIEYIAQNLKRSLEIMVKGAKGESIEEPDDLDKELALLEQKLNSIGDKVEVTKSQQVLIGLFNNSIFSLIKEFIKTCEKFDNFYLNKRLYFRQNNSGFNASFEEPTPNLRIENELSNIALDYNYETFNRYNFNEVGYSSNLQIQFKRTTYCIFIQTGLLISEKPYSQNLSSEDIDNINKKVADTHLNFIKELLNNVNQV